MKRVVLFVVIFTMLLSLIPINPSTQSVLGKRVSIESHDVTSYFLWL